MKTRRLQGFSLSLDSCDDTPPPWRLNAFDIVATNSIDLGVVVFLTGHFNELVCFTDATTLRAHLRGIL